MAMHQQSGDKPLDRPLRVGLIGATGYAYAYYEELTKLVEQGLVEWGAATVINPQQASEPMAFFSANGVPIYADYREMLEKEADKLDWVCIPTAISWHEDMAVDSLRKGLPILLEKPIAPTLQGVEAIQRAEREMGLPVAIGFQYVYCEQAHEAKRRILEGEIGDIVRIEGLCLWPRSTDYYERNNWAGRIRDNHGWVLDSPLHNALSHLVNLVMFLAGGESGERAGLTAMEAELYRAKPIENFDTVRCVGQLDSGVPATLILSHASQHRIDPEIRIHGTRGVYVWRFGGTHGFEKDGTVSTIQTQGALKVRERMFEQVVGLVRGERVLDYCSTEQAKGEVLWVNAVQDAAPVHDIPALYRRHCTDESRESHDVIENLEHDALRAYKENKSFREVGAPWAVEAKRLDLTGYSAFRGTFAGEAVQAAPVQDLV